MRNSSKRRILSGLIVVAATTTFIASAITFVNGCNLKREEKIVNPFIERLIRLNRGAYLTLSQSDTNNPFTSFEDLITLENKIQNLNIESRELDFDILNSQFSDKDFENIEFEPNRKVIMPKPIEHNILPEANANIIKKAKKYLEDQLNDDNFSQNNKNAFLIKIEKFTKISQFVKEYQTILKVKKFFTNLKSTIYYSTNAKQTILGDFHDINQTNEIVNYIDNYDVITSNKKEYYDSNLSEVAKTDEPIKYLNKPNFLDAVSLESVNKEKNDITELFELKKDLLENYLDNYAKNFGSEEVLRSDKELNDEENNKQHDKKNNYKRFLSLNMQSVIYSATKKEIQKFKNVLNNFMSNWFDDDKDILYDEYLYTQKTYTSKGEPNKFFDSRLSSLSSYLYSYQVVPVDQSGLNFLETEATDITDGDWNASRIKKHEEKSEKELETNQEEYELNRFYRIDKHKDKYILANIFYFEGDVYEDNLNPFFRYSYINLYEKMNSSYFNEDKTPAFSLINFFNRFLSTKEKDEKIKLYDIYEKIIRHLYQQINRDLIFDRYEDYFITHNSNREKANKRYNYMKSYISNVNKNIDTLIKEPLVLEIYKLSLTDDIDKVEENVNKFLEFLDSQI
ncbi:hypothetical protein [Mycoplasmopsis arginini]|uniref:hypothetical protein n=1 Tax=Mycoplasmopsis arginini TaxID=2094 RepID=UPI003D0342C0